MEQFKTTTGYPINAPQWPQRVYASPAWLDRVSKKLSVKADLLIYGNCVTVSTQCLGVAIIISNKMDFNSCAYMAHFPKSSHFCFLTMPLVHYFPNFLLYLICNNCSNINLFDPGMYDMSQYMYDVIMKLEVGTSVNSNDNILVLWSITIPVALIIIN